MKKTIVSILAIAAFVACNKTETSNTSEAAEAKKSDGKTLIYCSEGSPSGLNPQITEDGVAANVQNQYFNRLVAIERGKTNVIPDLAESWSVSKDEKSYTFKLRKDVKFHTTSFFKPTRNMNAEDVLWSFNRQLRKDHPYNKIGGGSYPYFDAMNMRVIKDVKKTDDYTVVFTLESPDSAFLANMTMEFASILSAEYADQMMKAGTPAKVDTQPIGTGPFIFKSYEKDSMVRMDANPEYYGSRKALVEKLIFVITPDPNVRTQKIKAGECNIISEPSVADYKSFESDSNLKIQSITGLNLGYLAINVKKKPFDNVLVRRALFHALNRASYVEAIYHGRAEIAESAIPSTEWGYAANLPTYEYSVEKAKDLLKKAGFPDGFSTTIWALPVSRPYNPDGKKMAEMMQADLAKVGIKATIQTYDWPTYLAKSAKGEHTLAQFGWAADNADPDNFLFTQLGCAAEKNGSNRAGWCYKPFNDLVEKAKHVSNVNQRTELYQDAQKIFKEQLPWIPLVSAKNYRIVTKNVDGFIMDPLSRDYFNGVSVK